MYTLKEQQINFILNDIRARGVELEDLQYNLLDHVCCIIEQNLKEGESFEEFYSRTIVRFYKSALWEVEEETLTLLIFKNYYKMKKIMLISGFSSAILLVIGIALKFLHLPGAGIGILSGTLLMSLVFLPLMFTLKIKEKQKLKDKITIGLGTLSGVLISLGVLFKIMHWPYANMLINASLVVLIFLFLPIYFVNGIRNPESKVNTMVSSIIMIAACGLLMAMARSPRASHIKNKQSTDLLLLHYQLTNHEAQNAMSLSDSSNSKIIEKGKVVVKLSNQLLNDWIFEETGTRLNSVIGKDFLIEDHMIGLNDISSNRKNDIQSLTDAITEYNLSLKKNANLKSIDDKSILVSSPNSYESLSANTFDVYNQLLYIQDQVQLNNKKLVTNK